MAFGGGRGQFTSSDYPSSDYKYPQSLHCIVWYHFQMYASSRPIQFTRAANLPPTQLRPPPPPGPNIPVDADIVAEPCLTIPIDSGWRYKQRDQNISVHQELQAPGWTNATQFPSEIHAELVEAGVIQHPYESQSDTAYQCGLTGIVLLRTFTLLRSFARGRRGRMAVHDSIYLRR